MKKILLINPNSSIDTLNMMVSIAQGHAGDKFEIIGKSAEGVPKLLKTDAEQLLAVPEVLRIAIEAEKTNEYAGIIIAAFSDPGYDEVKNAVKIPVVGIGFASMQEAVNNGNDKLKQRKFTIVTTTPDLVENLNRKVKRHGLNDLFLGVKIPIGDLQKITACNKLLKDEIKKVCEKSFDFYGADAVIIGGGPFAEIAAEICKELCKPVIAPIKSAVEYMNNILNK